MKRKKCEIVYAFIDSQNLNLGILQQGWKLDFEKFRIYLANKYNVVKAYLFIGYIPANAYLYKYLKESGYILIFKQVQRLKPSKIKGNVDAELVLQAMIDYRTYSKAIIVTGDGDFACLIKYLYTHGKLSYLMVPDINKYSGLLKKTSKGKILFMNNLRGKLQSIN